MALISMRQLLDHAAEHDYGVPAFNVNNLEQVRAIMAAADRTNSPVIIQASAGARKIRRANVYSGFDVGSDGRMAIHSHLYASRSWGFSGGLSALYSNWLYVSYDGWVIRSRHENPCQLRV